MKCQCGFKFAGPGEFRNCAAFVTAGGRSGVVCPECDQAYVDGQPVGLKEKEKTRGNEKGKKVE